MTWVKNAGPGNHGHHYYFVYGLERVGSLLGLEQLGGVNWYWDGAEYLVKNQRADGSWVSEIEATDTLLALLFLKRATAASTGRREVQEKIWRTEEPEAALLLAARGTAPLTLWVEAIAPRQREELEWPAEEGGGLRIEKVEYFGMAASGAEDYRLLATREGERGPADLARHFAAQINLDRRGLWFLFARISCMRPPATPGLTPELAVLESPRLRLTVEDVSAPGELEYAVESEANLLRGAGVQVSASSSSGQAEAPQHAVDGQFQTRWHCAPTDPAPWLELKLERPVRADRVTFSHGWPRSAYQSFPRPSRIEVVINGETNSVLEIEPDALRKSVLLFERPTRIRSLRLAITATEGGALGSAAFGFSEVELLLNP